MGAVLVSVFGMGAFPEMWARWYVGDAMGMLALLPLCMASNLAAWRHALSGRAGSGQRDAPAGDPGDQLRGP